MSASVDIFENKQVVHGSLKAKKINSLLNSPKSRVEGLRLLNLFLPQCPDEDFLQFCISWMQNCCKAYDSTKNKNYVINLLCNLFKISSDYQELKKSVSFFITTRYFDYFFKHFLNSEAGWFCTETCLLLYRGACGPFQESLEKHLRNEINKNIKISSTVSRCFALIPCVGGGGNEGINYKKNWKSQFLKFLDVCHSVLNELFANVEELQKYEAVEHRFMKNKKHSTEYLAIQLVNHISVLKSMLLNQYPAPKTIPSDLIFQLICRGLAVNPKALAKPQTTVIISLKKVLPEIHCTLLSLMQSLIVTCKNQLLPYCHLICKLIKQSLEYTKSDFINTEEEAFECFRKSTYETLCNWLAVARSGSCVETISNVVVLNAVNDITSKKEIIILKEAKFQHQSKNREQTNQRINRIINSSLCFAALKALQFLLKFVGILLRPEEHKFLQEVVIKIVVEIQKNSSLDSVVPFALPPCRRELYSLLLELVHQPCPLWAPPTNFALRLFSKGVNDTSPEVSLFCSTALNFTTIIIHPQYNNGRFQTLDDRNLMEMEPQWRELPNVENENGVDISEEKVAEEHEENERNITEMNITDPAEKLNNLSEGSMASSEEDSRNTVTFSKDIVETVKTNVNIDEVKESLPDTSENQEISDEPSIKKQKTFTEDPTFEKSLSPVKENLPENFSVKASPELGNEPEKPVESNHSPNLNSEVTASPESISEESQPKARYFLRSKTKGSSEEPEEILKRTSSPECLKSTPLKGLAKGTPDVQSAKNRLRKRPLSKVETNNGALEKQSHGYDVDDEDRDDENIKEAFDDSFVD